MSYSSNYTTNMSAHTTPTASRDFHIDDTASSILSDLNSAQFSQEYDLLEPEDAPSSTTTSSSTAPARKRKIVALETWTHAREPIGEKQSRNKDRKNERYSYCKHYPIRRPYRTTVINNARLHLLKEHGINIDTSESKAKKSRGQRIKSVFQIQAEKTSQQLQTN